MNAKLIYDKLKDIYRSDNQHDYVVGNIKLVKEDDDCEWKIVIDMREIETFIERHPTYASYEPFELGGIGQPTQYECITIKKCHSSQILIDIDVQSHVLNRRMNFKRSDISDIKEVEDGKYVLFNGRRKTVTNPFVFVSNDIIKLLIKILKECND